MTPRRSTPPPRRARRGPALRWTTLVACLLLLGACSQDVPPDDGGATLRPEVASTVPNDRAEDVARDVAIEVQVDAEASLDPDSLAGGAVRLERGVDGSIVDAEVRVGSGGTAIHLEPSVPLAPNAGYRLVLSDGVTDEAGSALVPHETSFATGTAFAEGERPFVADSDPVDAQKGVYLDTSVTTLLSSDGAGVDPDTATAQSVALRRASTGTPVAGTVTVSGGRDSIIFQPLQDLEPLTRYVFEVSDEVLDADGNAFHTYRIAFTTGTEREFAPGDAHFDRIQVYDGGSVASLALGPDGRLYAVSLQGEIRRWPIRADGTLDLAAEETFTGFRGRAMIGIAFDPDDPDTIWVTHNAPLTNTDAEDFTGAVAKVTMDDGDLASATRQDMVVGLPRSTKDHMTNSLAFGPDGALYVPQGSNTGAGAPDAFWGRRQERLLSATVLRIDPDAIGAPPVDVQTEAYEGTQGSYDPTAPGAPVTIYATGLRNAYDLVWHGNGQLYVPTNGGNGGNTPATPPGHVVEAPALEGIDRQPDYLFSVEEGGYYGHPNVLRGEYVLNGGNPTAGEDPGEVVERDGFEGYPVGTMPEPNYRGFVEEFCCNDSINGSIEYTADTFGGSMQGDLLLVRYASGGDLVRVELDAQGDMVERSTVMGGFERPLDIVEDPATGNIYLAELPGWSEGRIQLLRVGGQ